MPRRPASTQPSTFRARALRPTWSHSRYAGNRCPRSSVRRTSEHQRVHCRAAAESTAPIEGNASTKEQPLHINVPADAERHPLFVSFAGGGIYFFWQLGAVKYLREHYDLTKVPMAGASSGALVACLSACNVDPEVTVQTAYQLAIDNDIWNRRFGLVGIWGGLIRDWLDRLLPENAHELVSGRLHVIIAKAPTLELFEVNEFHSKDDLIEAVMASAHVPLFLDGQIFTKFRNRWCWDGSFPDFVYFENSDYLQRGGKTLVVDYSLDEKLQWVRGDFLKLRSYDETMALIEKGYDYVKRRDEKGLINATFDTKHYMLLDG